MSAKSPKVASKNQSKVDNKKKEVKNKVASKSKIAEKVKSKILNGAHVGRVRKVRTTPKFRRPTTYKAIRSPKYERSSSTRENK